jgi:hypothetical protein
MAFVKTYWAFAELLLGLLVRHDDPSRLER